MRRMLRLFMMLAMLAFAPFGAAMACTQPAGVQALESSMIGWINKQRTAKGLRKLSPSGKLAAAAQGHACDMAQRGYFGHQRAGGPDLPARVKAKAYRFGTIAENIAKTRSPEVSAAAGVWQNSAGHWANILDPKVTEIGIGIARGGDRTYWVMNVGRPR